MDGAFIVTAPVHVWVRAVVGTSVLPVGARVRVVLTDTVRRLVAQGLLVIEKEGDYAD